MKDPVCLIEKIILLVVPYFPDLFITVIGSFLGFFFALIIYRKQTRSAVKRKDRETMTEFIYRLKYLNISITNILKSSENQIAKYSDLAQRMKENPYEIHLVSLIAFNDFKRVSQMDSQEIFKAYIYLFRESGDSIKNYHNIYKSLDFLELALKQQIRSLEKNHQFIHSDQTRVKDLINGLSDDIASTLFHLARQFEDDQYSNNPVVKVLEEYLAKYRELVLRRALLHDYELEFSKPFREIMIKRFRAYNYTDYLVDKSRKAAVLLENIRFNSLEFAKQVEMINENLETALIQLESLNKEIGSKIDDDVNSK